MIKFPLLVTVWTGVGNSQTHSLDITSFDSMQECKDARAVVAQSQFPREWLTIQNDFVWQAEKPGWAGFDKYKLECAQSPYDSRAF